MRFAERLACYTIQRLTIFVELAGVDDGREGKNLSSVFEKVTFPRRTDLTEGH